MSIAFQGMHTHWNTWTNCDLIVDTAPRLARDSVKICCNDLAHLLAQMKCSYRLLIGLLKSTSTLDDLERQLCTLLNKTSIFWIMRVDLSPRLGGHTVANQPPHYCPLIHLHSSPSPRTV